MDIQQQLERDIGHGPPLPTPEQRLLAGRVALRRRRAGIGAGAAAALVALATPFAISAGGVGQGTELTPVAPPSATPSTSEGPEQPEGREPRFPEPPKGLAYFTVGTGELVIDPDAVVLRRIDDLYPDKGTESVALDLRLGEKHKWYVLEWDDGGGVVGVADPENDDYDSFRAFVAEVVSTGGLRHGSPVADDDPQRSSGTTAGFEGERLASGGPVGTPDQQLSSDVPTGLSARAWGRDETGVGLR